MAWIKRRKLKTPKKRPDGKSQPHVYDVRYRDPANRVRTRSFDRKVDAENFASTVETDKSRGEWVDPRLGRITLAGCAERYMATVVHLKPKTQDDYRSLLRSRVLPEFGERAIGSIRPDEVRQWIASMDRNGLSPSRIRHAVRLLGKILKRAATDGYIAKVPTMDAELPRLPSAEISAFTVAEVERLAQATAEPFGTWVLVMAYSGMRFGEGAALRRKSCDLLRSRIHISESLSEGGGELHFGPTKTHQARTVPIPSSVRDALAQHLAKHVGDDPDALVFTAEKGGPLRYSNFYRKVWTPALEKARLQLPPGRAMHVLRASFASNLGAAGRPIREAQAFLGHKSSATTDRYSRFFDDDIDSAAEALEAARQATNRALPRDSRAIELVADLDEAREQRR